MNWVNDALAEFGQRLGLASLHFDAQGRALLALSSGHWLTLEQMRRGDVDEVLVYLHHPLGFDAPRQLRQALERAHFQQSKLAFPLQIASHGQGAEAVLLVLTRLPAQDLTASRLYQAFEMLKHWVSALPT